MNQTVIKPESSFKVVSEWKNVDVDVGESFTILNTYSIRGTKFIRLNKECEDIPLYEFKYALRKNLIDYIE